MWGELWRYLSVDLCIALPIKSFISLHSGFYIQIQWSLTVITFKLPRNTPLLVWDPTFCLSQCRDQGGESQLIRSTRKRHKRELGGGLDHSEDQLFNGVPGWLEAPGFCSDSQELGTQTQSETEVKDTPCL